jgi:hypothetical protein
VCVLMQCHVTRHNAMTSCDLIESNAMRCAAS